MRSLQKALILLFCTIPMSVSSYQNAPEPDDSIIFFDENLVDEREVECLAYNIYFEARGEPLIGKIAVGNVTINRVKSNRFPDTICQVVYQSKTINGKPIRNKCQFSWYCDGKKEIIDDIKLYDEIYKLSRKMLQEDFFDVTEGSEYYHSNKVNPYWSDHMKRVVAIEDHIFYKRI